MGHWAGEEYVRAPARPLSATRAHELSSATSRHRPDKPAPPDATQTASGAHRVKRPPRQASTASRSSSEIERHRRASGLTDDNDNRPQGHHHPEFPQRWCVIEHIRATAPRRALPEPPRSLSPLRPAPVRVGPTTTDPVVGCSDISTSAALTVALVQHGLAQSHTHHNAGGKPSASPPAVEK